MKLRAMCQILCFVGMLLFLILGANAPTAQSGTLRINLTDGSSIEVPYYWEEDGQIKFDIPGGVAGIPRSQVSSVQEVVAAQMFDPEALMEQGDDRTKKDQQRALEELIADKVPSSPYYEKLSPEESMRLLKVSGLAARSASKERVHGPMFDRMHDFGELVRMKSGSGLMMVMQNVITSRSDLGSQNFTLALYDAQGKVLQKIPCEVYELTTDPKVLKELGTQGHVFSVVATVKPDPKISRYEIITAKR